MKLLFDVQKGASVSGVGLARLNSNFTELSLCASEVAALPFSFFLLEQQMKEDSINLVNYSGNVSGHETFCTGEIEISSFRVR